MSVERTFDYQPHDPPDEDEQRILDRGSFFRHIEAELERAYAKHGDLPWGRHEFFAILREEYKELDRAIQDDESQERVLAEALQVAAMCFRYFETGDRYRGEHPRTPFSKEAQVKRD